MHFQANGVFCYIARDKKFCSLNLVMFFILEL